MAADDGSDLATFVDSEGAVVAAGRGLPALPKMVLRKLALQDLE